MLNSIFGKRKEKSNSESVPSSVIQNYFEFDADYYARVNDNTAMDTTSHSFSTSFWPPIRCGQFVQGKNAVVLKSLEFVVDDQELNGFIKGSDVFRNFSALGIDQTIVKAGSKENSIHLVVDTNICPSENSYDLQVGNNQVIVVGAERQGLLYGLYTLLQTFKLFSEQGKDTSGQLSLTLPALVISDRPDVSQRAVLWSYRQQVRTSTARMQEQIELLSRLRMNTLFLTVDEPTATETESQALSEFLRLGHASLIDVIPTVLVTSIHQGYVRALYICNF